MMQVLEALSFAIAITVIIYFIVEYIIKRGFKFRDPMSDIIYDLLIEEGFDKTKLHYNKKDQTLFLLLGECSFIRVGLKNPHQVELSLGIEKDANPRLQQKEKKRLNSITKAIDDNKESNREMILSIICAEVVQWDKESAGITRQLP